jgi:hypothetical protein
MCQQGSAFSQGRVDDALMSGFEAVWSTIE